MKPFEAVTAKKGQINATCHEMHKITCNDMKGTELSFVPFTVCVCVCVFFNGHYVCVETMLVALAQKPLLDFGYFLSLKRKTSLSSNCSAVVAIFQYCRLWWKKESVDVVN